ncbi:MAG: HD domain-containing protein [Helicobacteraceae bacterium]|nr:HD domain-containing protein [Helicobacteraceae bacterium]
MPSNKNTYLSVDSKYLQEGETLAFNIYETNDDKKSDMALYLQSGTVLNRDDAHHLREIEHLYVLQKDKIEYEKFLNEHMKEITKNSKTALEKKTVTLYENATEAVGNIFSDPDRLENTKEVEKIVDSLVITILEDRLAISSLLKILAHDYYTHTHSINVSIYALSLGSHLNLSQSDLKDLGKSALLHDLGKSRIPNEIINKEGKLSNEEFEEIKKHPLAGYILAKKIGITDEKTLLGIRHHHEKLDGTGYPDGIKGDKISLFARIIGICDIFDALTTKRSYKKAMSTFDTLSLMHKRMSKHIDLKILNEFIKMFKAQEGKNYE